VDTAVVEVSGARLTLDQSIERGDELIARAKVVVVAVKDGRAARLPRAVIAAFARR
jgi:acyl-CoA thioester hydrolase